MHTAEVAVAVRTETCLTIKAVAAGQTTVIAES
jgi:hypothetical protein